MHLILEIWRYIYFHSGRTKSTSWLLMPWLKVSPGHLAAMILIVFKHTGVTAILWRAISQSTYIILWPIVHIWMADIRWSSRGRHIRWGPHQLVVMKEIGCHLSTGIGRWTHETDVERALHMGVLVRHAVQRAGGAPTGKCAGDLKVQISFFSLS